MLHLVKRFRYTPKPGGIIMPIHRPFPLGNPFKHKVDGTRHEVIQLYREWLPLHCEEPNIKKWLDRIIKGVQNKEDIYLVCYCAPLACHGQVIIDWVNERISLEAGETT